MKVTSKEDARLRLGEYEETWSERVGSESDDGRAGAEATWPGMSQNCPQQCDDF